MRGCGAALGLLLTLAVGVTAQGREPSRAAGGERLIEAMERAPATVVAEVLDVEQIDTHGYRGRLRVESALVGEVAPDKVLGLGWEELAPSRAPRFAAGDRILVVLEPLPGASIWRTRIPANEVRTATLTPASRGNAFLRSPSLGGVTLLSHYLMLEPELRQGPTGVGALAGLAARSEPPLGRSALERLARIPALDEVVDAGAAELLVVALLRADAAAEFQAAVLELIAVRDLESLRPPLESRAAKAELPSPLVLAALASLDEGLGAEQSRRLLGRDVSAEHRRVAARWASGPEAADLLARISREDPDPGVRSRAVARLVELEGSRAAGRAASGLYDPEASVRVTAATSLGSLGSAAVPELLLVVDSGSREAAQAAVTGLMLTESREGSEALAEIAVSHPDLSVRSLARLALGEDVGHRH